MTKQTFDLIMFTAFFGCILLAIYTNSLPESDHKDGLTLVLPIIILLIIPFTIVLPSLDMKQEMIDRYIKRRNQENFVTMLENNYETFVNDLMSDPNNKIVLDSGQYLKDVV